jgi:glucosyl-dolichyl phosphate glucuronosyltransferase
MITVAICTFNRAESLRRTLASLAAMWVPGDLDWELVIVNNNCTDHTDSVIAALESDLPVRRAFEPQQGHSHARNRAVDVARGDYIIWTDDDVVVGPGWLEAYAEAFRRWPDVVVFGGPIIPKYEEPVVKWVAESGPVLTGPYAIRDFGDEPLRLSVAEGRDPYGANFAIRTAEQRTFRYNPELGLGSARRRLGDETDVIERIFESGAIGYWVPAARVQHCISCERQTITYISRYFVGSGETNAFREGDHGAPHLFGAPRWLWRQMIQGWVSYHMCRFTSAAPIWVHHLRDYAYARGAIRYWRNLRR